MKNRREKSSELKWVILLCTVYLVLAVFVNVCIFNRISHGLLLAVNVLVVLICAFIGTVKVLKEKNNALKRENAFLKTEAELLKCYYEPIDCRIDEIKKYCHDARNVLNIISDKSAQGFEGSHLEQLAADFIRSGESFAVKEYCENRLVNSIIVQKKEEADRVGAVFYCDTVIPDALDIDPMDVCSCFFNILDNAIHANNVNTDLPKWISIKSNLIGSYLIIKLENTYFDTTDTAVSRNDAATHGLGLEIIRDIAKRNNGISETKKENGCYYTTISLQVKSI